MLAFYVLPQGWIYAFRQERLGFVAAVSFIPEQRITLVDDERSIAPTPLSGRGRSLRLLVYLLGVCYSTSVGLRPDWFIQLNCSVAPCPCQSRVVPWLLSSYFADLVYELTSSRFWSGDSHVAAQGVQIGLEDSSAPPILSPNVTSCMMVVFHMYRSARSLVFVALRVQSSLSLHRGTAR